MLSEDPAGLTANEILEEIKKKRGYVISRTSLSPQLSRLKVDGLVTVDKSIWHITPQGMHEMWAYEPEMD